MRRIRLTGPATRDIARILQQSGAQFGSAARLRYRQLIDQALIDLGEDPSRLCMQALDDVRDGYLLYHLKWSRHRTENPSVRNPRHLIAFRIDPADTLIVARPLHERQLLKRHLGEGEEG